jgi:hypothetical protein
VERLAKAQEQFNERAQREHRGRVERHHR